MIMRALFVHGTSCGGWAPHTQKGRTPVDVRPPHDSRKRSPPPTKTTEAYFRSCSATTSSDVSRAVRMASTMAWAVARVVQFVTR